MLPASETGFPCQHVPSTRDHHLQLHAPCISDFGSQKGLEMSACSCKARKRCSKYTCNSEQDILSLTAWKVSASHIVSLLPCTNKTGRVSSTKGESRRLSCRTTVRELAKTQRIFLAQATADQSDVVLRTWFPGKCNGYERKMHASALSGLAAAMALATRDPCILHLLASRVISQLLKLDVSARCIWHH